MKRLILLLFLLGLLAPAQAQDCSLEQYQKLLREAEKASEKGQYDLAINKLQSAKTCRPEKEAEVSAAILKVFKKVNGERKEAEIQRTRAEEQSKRARLEADRAEAEKLRIYANDLAFKSRVTLNKGDRTTAFRLASFAHQYLDSISVNVTQSLIDVAYYDEVPQNIPHAWAEATFDDFTYPVYSVAFTPDGKQLLTGAADNTLKFWDVSTKYKIGEIQAKANGGRWFSLSPDGKIVAFNSGRGVVAVHDVQTRQHLYTLAGHKSEVQIVLFAPNGLYLATYSPMDSCKIWNIETGKVKFSIASNRDERPQKILFTPDSKYLVATFSGENAIKVWDVQTGVEIASKVGTKLSSTAATITPDGQFMLIAYQDHPVQVFETTTWEQVGTIFTTEPYIDAMAFSPDGKWLAVPSKSGGVSIWDFETRQVIKMLEGHTAQVNCLAFSPDGKRLATGASDWTAKVWGLEARNEHIEFIGHKNGCRSVQLSNNGALLATGSEDKTVKLWNAYSGECLFTLAQHKRPIWDIEISDDARFVLSGSDDSTAILWDAHTGEMLQQFHANGIVRGVSIAPDTDFVALGSSDKTVKIIELSSGKTIYSLGGHLNWVTNLRYSNEGQKLTTGSADRVVKVWDITSGSNISSFVEPTQKLGVIGLSKNGELAAFHGNDNALHLWDIIKKQPLGMLKNANVVQCVDFDDQGDFVVLGDGEVVKIWSVKTGKNILSIHGHSNVLIAIDFSADGNKVVSSTFDNTPKIWDINPDSIIIKIQSNRTLASLTLDQLLLFDLADILDARPNNESILLATRETWQIAAFADLYTRKIAQTGFPQKADYERAQRLYRACLSHNVDNAYFQQKIDDLERLWKEKNN